MNFNSIFIVMKVHFIAIGGSIMHALAISLKQKGYNVTGSDDKFYSPSKDNLKKENLLPEEGWFPEKITNDLDFVILGMHAKINNPELIEAREKKIKIYSFPEYIAKESRNKKRIVIAGSHGKTTITSMIMYVLKENNFQFDYVVGAKIKGFKNLVKLSDNKIIVIEGDEYLSSKLDNKSKFLHYSPDLLVISGISWDHVNVFSTYKSYLNTFIDLLVSCSKKTKLFFVNNDNNLKNIIKFFSGPHEKYFLPAYKINDGQVEIKNNNNFYRLSIFGEHNLYNLEAARKICNELGLSDNLFYKSISSFSGAKNRLELFYEINSESKIYRDFAHSPSKVKASVSALKKLFPKNYLIACLELYTFSSLTLEFLVRYKKTFEKADFVWIFYSKKELIKRGMHPFNKDDVQNKIDHKNVLVFTDKNDLKEKIRKIKWFKTNLLLMSSGNFHEINFKQIIHSLK